MSIATYLIKKPSSWIEKKDKFSFSNFLSIVKRKDYILTWLMFFINITCGLVIISFEKSILLSIPTLLSSIAIISSCSAGFNTLGRFGYSTGSDYLDKKYLIYSLIFITSFYLVYLYFLLD